MPTVKARLLLGWMPQNTAMDYLLNQCVFDQPLTPDQAEALWLNHRQRVQALPDRACALPARQGLSPLEASHGIRFMAFLNGRGAAHDVIGVHKVELSNLTVRQLYVITERSEQYAQRLLTPHAWLNECLPTADPQVVLNLRTRQAGMNTYTEIDVPHAEFLFVPDMRSGNFSATQMLRHITVMEGQDRAFLWAGYHRTFAIASSTPTATVPAALLAFARNVMNGPALPPAGAGNVTGNGIDPLSAFGAKAPRFGDFFVDDLFMDVNLREKRFQLQVRADLVALDAP